eukprot:12934629-Prorocentrum_lima.AAC.1
MAGAVGCSGADSRSGYLPYFLYQIDVWLCPRRFGPWMGALMTRVDGPTSPHSPVEAWVTALAGQQ